jgi:outer membrane protein assembly factor BamA
MNMRTPFIYPFIVFLAMSVFSYQLGFAQDEIFTDSLSHNVMENIYKEEPKTVSNDSSNSKKRTSFNGYPYVFYTPESKFAAGAGGIFIFYGGREKDLKPSKIGFGGYYSTNKQYKISISPNLYFLDNKLYIELPTSYGFFINKYWGIGDNTPVYDSAGYAVTTFTSTLTVQVPPEFFAADRTGVILDLDYTDMTDKQGNELLQNDSLPGSNGGTLIGLGTDLVWDSRDNLFFPNSGGYQYFKVVFYPGMSDYIFSLIELDVKAFRSISPDHVFAFNFYVQSALGETPFYKLPALGGQKRMRGYFNGRYRDNFYGMLQAEYRQYFWKRLGFAVFGGVGNVADNMLEYDFSTLKYSYGAGLRFLFNKEQKVNLRMDIGFGNDGNRGIYFGIQEAF